MHRVILAQMRNNRSPWRRFGIRLGRVHGLPSFQCDGRRLDEPSDTCRPEPVFGPPTGPCQNVQLRDYTGSGPVLCRCVLAAGRNGRADVSAVLPASQERTGSRRQYSYGVKGESDGIQLY